MAKQLKTEAIVLKKNHLLNQDIMLTLFTQEIGKVGAMAKGVKKITSKRLPHIQTGNLIRVILHESHNMYFLQNTELISGFTDIKKKEEKIRTLYVFFFILERLLPERQQESDIYVLTKSFEIQLANEKKNVFKILNNFLNTLMQKLGYIDDQKSIDELIVIIEDLIHEKVPLI